MCSPFEKARTDVKTKMTVRPTVKNPHKDRRRRLSVCDCETDVRSRMTNPRTGFRTTERN